MYNQLPVIFGYIVRTHLSNHLLTVKGQRILMEIILLELVGPSIEAMRGYFVSATPPTFLVQSF